MGGAASFTVSACGNGATVSYQWKKDGNPVSGPNVTGATSATLSINPVGAGDFGGYTCTISTPCSATTPTSNSAALTVTPSAVAPTSITASTSNYCSNNLTGSLTLTANGGSGTTLEWSTSCGGTVISNANPLVISAPTTTTTYFARWTNSCGASGCAQTTITVNQAPNAPSVGAGGSVCPGGSFALTASAGANEVVDWTTDGGMSFFATGTSVSVTPGSTTTYFARARNTVTGCTSSTFASETVTVTPLPVAPSTVTASQLSYCAGSPPASIMLGATGGSGTTFEWSTSCGGTAFSNSNPATISPPASTTTYYARWTTSCGASACGQVTVTVNPLPGTPTAGSGGTIVAGGSFGLTASAGPGQTVDWYTGGCGMGGGGTLVGSGSPLTVSPGSTTTYFGQSRDTTTVCRSAACASVTVGVMACNPTLDGVAEQPDYGAALAVQAAPTGYGDNSSAACPANGSELDQAFGVIRNGTLYLTLTGNLQNNFNKLLVFVDSTAGGQNTLRGDNDGGNSIAFLGTGSGNDHNGSPGLTFDSAFAPDYALAINLDSTCFTLYADWFTLPSSSGGTKTFLGLNTAPGGDGTLSGGSNPSGIRVTINNSNTGGVTGASAAGASGVATGVEIAIPLAALGGPTGTVNVSAMIAGSDYHGLSNQVLGPLASNASNYGLGSYRNFQSDGDAPGNQYFTVPVSNTGATDPTSVAANVSSYCSDSPPASGTITLTATGGSGTTLEWFDDSCGGHSIGTTNPLTIAAPTSTTTYYARWESACGNSACAQTTVTVYPLPTADAGTGGTICADGSIQLHGTASNYLSVYWAGGTGTFTDGDTLNPTYHPGPFDAGSVTLTLVANANAPCVTSVGSSVDVSVQQPPSGSASGPSSMYVTEVANITASVADAASYSWSVIGGAGTFGTPTGTGTDASTTFTLTSGTIGQPVTLRLSTVAIAPCTSSTPVATVSFTVAAPPCTQAQITGFGAAGGDTYCAGQSVMFTTGATGSSPITFHLKRNGLEVASGQTPSFTISNLQAGDAGTYTVTASNACTPESAASSPITLHVKQKPTVNGVNITPPLGPGDLVCIGQTYTVTVSATSESPMTYSFNHNGAVQSGSSNVLVFVGSSADNGGNLDIQVCNECGCSPAVPRDLSALPSPQPPTGSSGGDIYCSASPPASITMTATGGSGDTLKWYLGGCGSGTAVGMGPTLTLTGSNRPTTAGTYLYYPRWESNFCGVSTCGPAVTVRVYPTPADPTNAAASMNPVCSGGATVLTASGAGPGVVLSWFEGTCGGSSIGDGALTVHPTTTTTYYAKLIDQTGGNCQSIGCASVTVLVNDNPTAPTGSSGGGTYCSGNPPTSVALNATGGASGTGGTLNWYLNGCGTGSPVATGASTSLSGSGLPTAPGTYTYYPRWETPTCGSSPCGPAVTVTVNATPADPTGATATPSHVCSGTPVTLSVGGAGGTISAAWYEGSCAGTSIGTGSPTVTPTATTTYYVRLTDSNGGCSSVNCASVTVTVDQANTAASSASVTPSSYCASDASGQTITLTATGGSGGTLKWYSGTCGGTFVGDGSPLVIAAPGATTQYYARWEGGLCAVSSCVTTTVTVNNAPDAPTAASVSPSAACAGSPPSPITLHASGGGGGGGTGLVLRWYADGCGGGATLVGEGDGFVVSSPPSVSTTYYARWESSCGSSACAQAEYTVNPIPAAPTAVLASPGSVCHGAGGQVTLSASAAAGTTLEWYSGTCGVGTPIGTGPSIQVSAPSVTTTYSVRAVSAATCASSCTPVTVTVDEPNVIPSSASVSPDTYCSSAASGLQISLTATGGSGGTLTWYSGSCGGTPVGTGSPLLIAAPSTTTTYYARWEGGACASSMCASTTVTVQTQPDPPSSVSISTDATCGGSPATMITLHAAGGGGSGATLQWYTDGCGVTPVGHGDGVIVAPPPPAGTTYYARWENSCGNSACASGAYTGSTGTVPPTINATVDLAFVSTGTFDRCITFEFYTASSCPNPASTQTVTMHFVNGEATASFPASCDTYTCITARDRMHTLRRTTDSAHLTFAGNTYTASFTDSKALLGGNLNDDPFIDILDFGGFVSRFNTHYASHSTDCSYTVIGAGDPRPTLHADFNGDGVADVIDFSFISTQYLAQRDALCCSTLSDGQATMDISVWELAGRGDADSWEIARTADLNHDGRLNLEDAAFLSAHGLPRCAADFNGSGAVQLDDLFDYLTAWFSGHPATDLDDNHRVNIPDLFLFIDTWFAGCP